MDSHITVPKCVLKQFALDKNGFYKYNVQTKIISRGYPRTTFTEEGYFSKSMETMLSDEVETPLNKLFKFVKLFDVFDLPSIIPAKISEIAVNYVKALIARSPMLFDSAKKESIFLQFMTEQEQHDLIVYYAMQEEKMDEIFDRFDLSFMINESDTPFVLPIRGVYEYRINNVLCMNIPLNPRCSLMFKEKGKQIHRDNKNIEIMFIPKGYDDIAKKLNGFAFQRQKQDGKGYVVCNKKMVLEELIK